MSEMSEGNRVVILAADDERSLAFRGARVALPALGTVTAIKGANGYYTYFVYVDALGTTRGFSRSRLQSVSRLARRPLGQPRHVSRQTETPAESAVRYGRRP